MSDTNTGSVLGAGTTVAAGVALLPETSGNTALSIINIVVIGIGALLLASATIKFISLKLISKK